MNPTVAKSGQALVVRFNFKYQDGNIYRGWLSVKGDESRPSKVYYESSLVWPVVVPLDDILRRDCPAVPELELVE